MAENKPDTYEGTYVGQSSTAPKGSNGMTNPPANTPLAAPPAPTENTPAYADLFIIRTYMDGTVPRKWIEGIDVAAVQRGNPAGAVKTQLKDGIASASFPLPHGLTQLFVRPPTGPGCPSLRSGFENTPLLFQFDGCHTLDVALSLMPAEVRVSASVVNGKGGYDATRPLLDFTVSLFRGSTPGGRLLRQVDSNGSPEVVLSDLDDDYYNVQVNPSKTYKGPALERIDNPAGAFLKVCAGQSLQMDVSYRISEGRVSARAVANGAPLAGVSFVLVSSDSNAKPLPGKSADDGFLQFGAVPPGSYTVRLEQEVTPIKGVEYVVAPGTLQSQNVTVIPGDERVVQFNMTEDIHRIFGTVTNAKGVPIPFATVHFSDESGQKSKMSADKDGKYDWTAPHAGRYEIWLDDPPKQRIVVHVNSEVEVNPKALSRQLPPGGPGGGDGEVRESFIDLQAYPILTESINSSSMPATSTSGTSFNGGGYLNLGQTVDNALKDVLSWRPKANDPKSFMTALTQAFELNEVEGHTSFSWKPKSYTVQTDLGEVTGAQASIYTRAKVAFDQVMPLLNGLRPLTNELAQEDLDSMRVVISTAAKSVVDEFGREGGPRVPRVDQLFILLLGSTLPVRDPELVGGQLDRLRQRFGLQRPFVNTISDEQNLTNFLILVDYLSGLQTSWEAQKPFFTRNGLTTSGKEPFFGTQLVLLSRSVEVITQSVQDVYFAMDSVFLGAAERGTIELDYAGEILALPGNTTFTFDAQESSLFVDEILEWTLQASQEGLQYLRDGGKDGVDPFTTTIDRVRKFIRGALLKSLGGVQDPSAVPAGYKTPRVQRAILDLANQIDEAHRLATGIMPSRLESHRHSAPKKAY